MSVALRERTAGLSPRSRGNHGLVVALRGGDGPIPALAGEPFSQSRSIPSTRAYPRARGGTMPPARMQPADHGLSPRSRGNREAAVQGFQRVGPIPALAGEPPRHRARRISRRAYPRARGGTRACNQSPMRVEGLSPRSRGNRLRPGVAQVRSGPIPALAGEPPCAPGCGAGRRAYPRARGGTGGAIAVVPDGEGLSPRSRGNPKPHPPPWSWPGPIPALAGEPCTRSGPITGSRAYPRARGGTQSFQRATVFSRGLSPRSRGNLRRLRACPSGLGPIPALAGEPETLTDVDISVRAYPRARGGTWYTGTPMDSR